MIYENNFFYIEKEESQIPWLKIFTKKEYKELSHCPKKVQKKLFKLVLKAEKAMLEFYKPDKINIASFANYVPRVHFHVMARFKDDAFFPECMWGKQQREIKSLNLADFNDFVSFLHKRLKK
ncbi:MULTISPECIES: HIT family protein [unclassified Campylobacter]|uniref:HIT family protein n=1 Tax=unclassified Campylobacter TaxID=2593542 RepID=UPI001237C062|nr:MULTISPECIES: HIT family protein [unclassified Campylobacter]KAA6224929.1 HIT family protein [Campylobacter sp. LR286c]KAA6228406.1 HIT family protein [Campylobacter sp. LR185c]KAA6228892.1 HIT family protein [Campylobacter sp. LR196d]KAA6229846.1 HIT family protein [Campylobacter sp. LR264d]KAA6234057.1 HIT family protein [Campylobacter sp. LR291e]